MQGKWQRVWKSSENQIATKTLSTEIQCVLKHFDFYPCHNHLMAISGYFNLTCIYCYTASAKIIIKQKQAIFNITDDVPLNIVFYVFYGKHRLEIYFFLLFNFSPSIIVRHGISIIILMWGRHRGLCTQFVCCECFVYSRF